MTSGLYSRGELAASARSPAARRPASASTHSAAPGPVTPVPIAGPAGAADHGAPGSPPGSRPTWSISPTRADGAVAAVEPRHQQHARRRRRPPARRVRAASTAACASASSSTGTTMPGSSTASVSGSTGSVRFAMSLRTSIGLSLMHSTRGSGEPSGRSL